MNKYKGNIDHDHLVNHKPNTNTNKFPVPSLNRFDVGLNHVFSFNLLKSMELIFKCQKAPITILQCEINLLLKFNLLCITILKCEINLLLKFNLLCITILKCEIKCLQCSTLSVDTFQHQYSYMFETLFG